MTDEQIEKMVGAINGHGDQLGGNLVHLKRFVERLQNEQQSFLAQQREASDQAQKVAHTTAIWSCIAAVAASAAAIAQVVIEIMKP